MKWAVPSQKHLTRTVFWTFWCLTVALTIHAACLEFWGIGIWLRDFSWPKMHMRGEIVVARLLMWFTVPCLAVVSTLIIHWSRSLCILGFLAVGSAIFYFGIART